MTTSFLAPTTSTSLKKSASDSPFSDVTTGRVPLSRSVSEAPTGCRNEFLRHFFLAPDGKTASPVLPTLHPSPPCAAIARCAQTGNGNDRPMSSSKHFRSLSIVDPVSPAELARMLAVETRTGNDVDDDVTPKSPRLVIVDCRTFIAFNTNHVTGAFNASCGDRFSRKRLTQGRATVADLISGGPDGDAGCAKESFRQLVAANASGIFIAYDDDTNDLDALQESHPLRLLTTSLTGSGFRTKFLAGGLQAFHEAYSPFCSKPDQRPSRPFLYSPTTPVVELDVDQAEMSAILPFLFIGNERDAANRELLSSAGISHVLNVTSVLPTYFDDDVRMTYKRLAALDSSNQNLKQYFDEAVAFIESARCSGGRVLVHCRAGVSRSPTIVIAYLMARYCKPLMDTFFYVKQRRSIVAPNFHFMGQLLEFEQQVLRGDLDQVLREGVPLDPLPTAGDA